jgi:hypothetical protein
MSKLRSFIVWVFEMLCEAIGTTTWMAILALIKYGPDHGHYPHGYTGVLFGISSMVLIEFALTGYLLTTLLAAQFLPRDRWFLYPLASFVLYLIHSGIFFVAAGNRLLDKENLTIQIGGASIAFGLTLIGDHFRNQTDPLPENRLYLRPDPPPLNYFSRFYSAKSHVKPPNPPKNQ